MKNILLGVTGGIASYKSPELVRRLVERDTNVRVVMTAGAAQFITPLTLQAVSGNEVRTGLFDVAAEAAMSHIELARWADEILVAPATAAFMSRLASGAASDLLSTLCLASEAPITLAPAMNRVMWSHPATIANRDILAGRGVRFIGPAEGDQACGEVGAGRMVEPLDIAEQFLSQSKAELQGATVLITAGPTREPLDPVRFLSNRSSGRMGYALAQAFREAGASVRLASGPVAIDAPAGIEVHRVETASEMLHAVEANLTGVDIFVGAAAIADYSPAAFSDRKMKKTSDRMQLDMVRAPDILANVAARPNAPFTVGFAAETNDIKKYALGKLEKKKLDMIVANRVGDGEGFDVCDNTVCVYWHAGVKSFPRMHKLPLARELVALIAERYRASASNVARIKGTVA